MNDTFQKHLSPAEPVWVRLKSACKGAFASFKRGLFPEPKVTFTPTLRARVYPLGFEAVRILPGESRIVESFPQIPFRATRLIIPAHVAARVEILDIKVGQNSCIANGVPIPGEAFAPGTQAPELSFDTAQVSQRIVLVVRNTSQDRVVTFSACMMGLTFS